jgi:hypothetical protein
MEDNNQIVFEAVLILAPDAITQNIANHQFISKLELMPREASNNNFQSIIDKSV